MKYLFFSCLLGMFLVSHAQSSAKYITFQYVGERLTHPGLGMQWNLSRPLSTDSVRIHHRLDLGLSLVGYLFPKNHVGTYLTPTLGYFLTYPTGFEIGATAGLGYFRRWYAGDVFEVEADGSIHRKRLAGQNALLLGGYLSLGQNFFLFKGKPLRWFVQVGAFWEYPYNTYLLLHPHFSVGISKYIGL